MLVALPPSALKIRQPIRTVQPARAPRKDEIEYFNAINSLNGTLIETTNRVNALIEAGASPEYIRLVLQESYTKENNKYSLAAPTIAATFLYALSSSNKKKVESTIAYSLNTSPSEIKTLDPQDLDAFIKESIAENVRLIKTIPNIYFNDMGEAIYKHFSGVPIDGGITERLSTISGVTQTRAAFIARDQTAKLNGQLTRYRHESVGIKKYKWRNAQDQRVVGNPAGLYPKGHKGHGNHWVREGVVYYYNRPPADGNPGYPYQCVLGGSNLDSSTFINTFYRRWYTGELTTLVLDNGVVLTATPNHPILTSEGFKAINDVDIRHDVINTMGKVGNCVENNIHSFNITFEQIFNAVSKCPAFSTSRGIGGEFHGDITDKEIDVISCDRALVYETYVISTEKIAKLGLSNTDMMLCRTLVSCDSNFIFFCKCLFPTLSSFMGSFNLILTLLRTKFTPFELFCLALCSSYNTANLKVSSDYVSRNIKEFSDLIFAYAFLVKGFDALLIKQDFVKTGWNLPLNNNTTAFKMFSKSLWQSPQGRDDILKEHTTVYHINSVVDKSVRQFNGHVYNLETDSGLYHTEKIIKSNCRCYAEAILDTYDLNVLYNDNE
jgi:hypothetical protein